MTDPSIPPSLCERYEPLSRLGGGAFGTVHRVLDRRLDRAVALKLMRPLDLDVDLEARFLREARSLAELDHPNIVRVLDQGVADGQLYLVTELVEGHPFDRLPAGVDSLAGWLQVGEALAAVHARGMIHRDVKPANAILEPRGRAVLIDFGLARGEHHEQLTRTGQIIGSLIFMAPEILTGEIPGPAADWYSWGVGLFWLLEGTFPYSQEEVAQALRGTPRPPLRFRTLQENSPERVLLEALLQIDPKRRPNGWTRISEHLAGDSLPSPIHETARTPARWQWLLSPLLAVAVIAGLLLPGSERPLPVVPEPVVSLPNGATSQEEMEATRAAAEVLRRRTLEPHGSRIHVKAVSASELDALATRLLDPRIMLAWTRLFQEARVWLRALAAKNPHITAHLRLHQNAVFAQNVLVILPRKVTQYIKDISRELPLRTGNPISATERVLKLKLLEQEMLAYANEQFAEVAAEFGEPPLPFVCLEITLNSLMLMDPEGQVRSRRILPLARELPDDHPMLPITLATASRYLRGQIPAPNPRHGALDTDNLVRCDRTVNLLLEAGKLAERARTLPEVSTSVETVTELGMILKESAVTCPGIFRDRVVSIHRIIGQLTDEVAAANDIRNPKQARDIRDRKAKIFQLILKK